ncbi:MAG: metal-sensitive transcriptional regulator [Oscillospiraceae bacterium]|nr:metal-sensitive transcriptional regulator [Oscillospiraceae bacterium]
MKKTGSDDILRRLGRIEGQVRGVKNMVETGKDCVDVLIQIGAVKAALHKTGQAILSEHLHHCVVEGIRHGNEEETIKKLLTALEQFSRIV